MPGEVSVPPRMPSSRAPLCRWPGRFWRCPPHPLQVRRSCVCAPPARRRFCLTADGHLSLVANGSKIAVVTGGSAGVGRAAVRELAARGYDVSILARGQPGLDGAVADLKDAGRRGLGISVDVADAGAVDMAAEQVERELGPI